MKQVEVYTDGACSGNPGPGGWGAVLRYRFNGKVYEKELSGGDASTTNNRMELTAFIEALRQLKEPCEVRLCSDSQYVINGLEKVRRLPCPEPRPLGAGPGAGSPPQAHLRLGQRPRRPPGERTLRPACGRPEPGTWRETGTMNDAFLPGNGFDTYEEQDRVLMGLSGSVRSGVAVRILQQQGFAVAAAVVRLADTPEEHAAVDAAKALAKKLNVECVTLNAEALAGQDAEAARFAALLTAADKLGIQYIASGRYARIETDAQGMSHLFAPESGAPDESGTLAALPPEALSRLILPLGDFAPEDVAEMAADFKL